ncbi:heme-binding protein [Altererythrobacter sp. KTW20L]|uniref:heme-binding protein n=1 Tax=Altererythrobacter sp. KTW20L TaxID=2942210 RepID=UPI0020BD8348|nr:heme-binding protein [Altererythrobacter sp. KTW20L]MCL6251491.1 heme-binding protein [Altererythrobacter sp. KTW20L]
MALRGTTALFASAALVLSGCGGSSTPGGGGGGPTPTPTPTPPSAGGLFTSPALEFLTTADVQQVLAQAVGEANRRGQPSWIAVTDRVGNVLATFRMTGAPDLTRVSTRTIGGNAAPGSEIGLQGAMIPASAAAIAKAITGAYLSSSGNAFSSRTASMIVQEHFPPAPTTVGLESGPLFGVQFSQLPCSDLNARFLPGGGAGALIGPKRSPLGLAADPGGFPLYKNGVVVGGVGVMGDGDYGFDANVLDTDMDAEEAIALAGTIGFTPPEDIRADRIFVDGTSLRFSDATPAQLGPLVTAFATVSPALGSLQPVAGYSDGTLRPGTAYGTEASGLRAATPAEFSNRDAFVLTDGSGNPRYPIRGGTDGASVAQPLTAAEVRAVMEEAFAVLSRARAQIRRPLDSRMQASVSVVDTHGAVLGLVRSPDGPVFGVDVSLQKARTATFFSNPAAAAQLQAAGGAVSPYVQRLRTFLGDPAALTGTVAFADRSGGNLARPYFPDGEVSRPPGPLSVQNTAQFSPFAVGLQSDLIGGNVVQHVTFIANGGAGADTPVGCGTVPDVVAGQKRLANGIQIFPGSVPIYRGGQLVGGIGVSGDGIDQDDMVSFLGLHNAGLRVGGIGNAAPGIRADRIVVDLGDGREVRLRYVSCPFAPFLDTAAQNVCQGL